MGNKEIPNDIVTFYDQFSGHQKKVGKNIRIRTIFSNLKREGLNKHSSILEIGCGIGILSELFGKYCPRGKIVATDISPKMIEQAKIRNKKFHNIDFLISDMSDFSYEGKFDFVVLADVLEHIPIENHDQLFKTISRCLHSKSKIVINIPSPYYNEWLLKYEPQSLQIIDQVLHTNHLLPNIYQNGLYLYSLYTYSLFMVKEDYQWMVVKPAENIDEFARCSKNELRIKEIKSRLFHSTIR